MRVDEHGVQRTFVEVDTTQKVYFDCTVLQTMNALRERFGERDLRARVLERLQSLMQALLPRQPADVQNALAAKFPLNLTELVVFPNNFACPSAVMQDVKSGEHTGISDVMSPWSGAVAQT